MEELAGAVYVAAAGAAIVGILFGTVGGIVIWKLRAGLILGTVIVVAAYLVADYADTGLVSMGLTATFGLPPLVLALLVCWLTARWLETHARWHSAFIALAAIACTLVVGYGYMLLHSFPTLMSVWAALGTDVVLAVLCVRDRKRVEHARTPGTKTLT